MASHAAVTQAVGTLVAATVDTITFNSDCEIVEVWADAELTFRVDGGTPVSDDDEGYNIPVAGARQVRIPTSGNTVVKLISAGTPNYVVTKIS